MNQVVAEHDDQAEAARKSEFEQVMAYVAERTWDAGTEELVMSTLFDLVVGVGIDDGEDLGL